MARRLLLLNGLAVGGVVLNHATGWSFTAMFWWAHRYLPVTAPNFDQMGSAGYYSLLVLQQMIMFAVPAFLFVSGYFIAFATARQSMKASWRLIRSRAIYLLVPYLVWTFLVFGLDFADGERRSVARYLELLVTGKTTPAYYFIPLLLQLYLLSPLLVRAGRRSPVALLLVTLLVQMSIRALVYLDTLGVSLGAVAELMPLTGSWFFPGHLFWFSAGIIGFLQANRFREIAVRGRKWFLMAALLLLPLCVIEWQFILNRSEEPWLPMRDTLLDALYGAMFILAFIGYETTTIPFTGPLEKLATRSFGVYLVHSPALELGARAVYFVAPWILGNVVLFQIILLFFGFGVPLVAMSAVEIKGSPVRGSYRYLFG